VSVQAIKADERSESLDSFHKIMINRMTGEPILPARTADQYLATILPARIADQYLARYWSAIRAGKIGSPVMRFIRQD
jgi:hypothetical protein